MDINPQIAVGAPLALSHPIINAAANAIGVAKTGTAIGILHGAAHTSATAVWIGFGSMKFGMFMMGSFPVIGALLVLDSICVQEHGAPLIDWYEAFWKRYEIECELGDLKQQVKPDTDHQLRSKTRAASFAQLDHLFQALEVEHELYLLKKELGLI